MSSTPARDIGSALTTRVGTVPFADTGTVVNGTSVDRSAINTPLSCQLVGAAGAATGSPSAQTADFKIQDSADDSTFADFSDKDGAAALTQLAADNASAVRNVDLSGARQFIRVVSTVVLTGGASPTWPVASFMEFGGGSVVPTA